MDDDAFTRRRGREQHERASRRAQTRWSVAEERVHRDGASARRILHGHDLLSDDELNRLERQVKMAQTAKERDDLHALRVMRLRIATVYLAALLVIALTTIAGGTAAGLTFDEIWQYVNVGG